jgi:predicted enzyme related to lactoylglutathione lyase
MGAFISIIGPFFYPICYSKGLYNPFMSTVESFAPGDFCWIELATTNQNAAKSFYRTLFGWTVRDVPTGPDEMYSLLELQGRIAAGAFGISPSESAAGVPTHWHLYVAVANADEAARKAAELGGKVLEGPFDVADRGRAALIQDPTGAYFSLWEGKNRPGMGVTGEPGAFCWADLTTPDQARAKTFYEGLFGWELRPGQGKESDYLHIVNGESYIGGVPPAHRNTAEAPPHWLIYFAVADVDATFRRAKDMNARILLRPMDFEGVGRVAMLADLQGAVFALYREAGK